MKWFSCKVLKSYVPHHQSIFHILQHYGQVQSSTVVLYNSGKVDLEFCAMGVVTDSKQLAPGQVSISPAMVCLVPTLDC